MAQKHLHELLTQAQEPFLLSKYVSDRRSQLQRRAKKTKPPSETGLCNHSCFFSRTRSPDHTQSPFSGVKTTQFDLSPLLEAAERIKNRNPSRTHNRSGGFGGVFGSVFKKFVGKSRGAKCEKLERLGSFVQKEENKVGSHCSCSTDIESDDFLSSLPNSPSTCIRSPDYSSPATSPIRSLDYSSPATSPIRSDTQGNCEEECISKKRLEGEEGEKDHFSPVSTLDPPFEDDKEHQENEEDEDDYDIECSYAVVQRAKEQLLERLLRFEKLAELDPLELERSILDTKSDNDNDDDDDDEELDEYRNDSSGKIVDMNKNMIFPGLIAKRKRDGIDERKIAARRVCKRVGSREKIECKTKIHMIVEFDLRREVDHWWKTYDRGHLEETAVEVELSIFALLVGELMEELL